MKGNIRLIIGILIGSIISGITVFAAVSYSASNITYKDTTVDKALDELYAGSTGKAVLLWEKDSDVKSLSQTVINKDLSDYKSIIVVAIYHNSYPTYNCYTEVEVGSSKRLSCVYDSATISKRDFTVTTEGITISDGIAWNNTTNNFAALPKMIIGIKK